jgi:catechol 2,3-dioxygenase-like lactoylglutathione lyase family enzyme
MSANPTQVVDVGGVAVPVADQARAVRFYVDTLGFEVRLDVPMGDGARWVQVAAPGGKVPIALVAAGDAVPVGVDTGITLATSDAVADHASLVSCGVDTDELLRWPGVPAMFAFRDQDGNQLKIVESASENRGERKA